MSSPSFSPYTFPFSIPLSSPFSLADQQRRTACQPLVLQSDLAAPLCWPPAHLARRDQSTAWQHPGTSARTRAQNADRALIQTNASNFTSVCRRAGSQRGNRMFLTHFVTSQRAGLEPKSGVKVQSYTKNNAAFSSFCLSQGELVSFHTFHALVQE